ncbi:methyl-accepting chemotaxis protein [Paenibacillus periandrae]|uniref:methyl-accepting chemotaxis protein n=1 Tax=Paenibacillus periandrae TaxID=1761741 RepID=UPI001F09CA9E
MIKQRALMQFTRIQTKFLVFMLPILICLTLSLSWISYTFSQDMITHEIEGKMNNQLQQTIHDIQNKLSSHTRIPQTVARLVEARGMALNPQDYKDMLLNVPSLNPDTLGVGVWFEPNRYKQGQQYFGPYVYKDGDKITYTEQYMTAEYDYPTTDWYRNGVNTRESAVFTDPYYDETIQTTMITATVPFYDERKQFLGVTTGDISLNSMQQMIKEIKVGETGWAFLMDKTGKVIADRDAQKVMKDELYKDANPSLAALGTKIMEDVKIGGSSGFQGGFEQSGKQVRVFYSIIPETGWSFALAIPEQELYAPLNSLLQRMLVVIVIAVLVMIGAIIAFSRYITTNIHKVNALSTSLAEGDFNTRLEIRTKDEFEQMGHNFNRTIGVLKGMMGQISVCSQEVATQAEQLKQGAMETNKATEEIATSIQGVAEGTEKEVHIIGNLKQMSTEVSQGMEQIAGSVELVSESSSTAMAAATAGNESLYELIRQMNTIHGTVHESFHSVKQLQDKSQQIDDIVSMITTISGQTSMLSLNAAIEAARAGEAGKGFAVVAGEVRKLADQAAQAANQIRGMIAEIQGTIQQTAQSMESGRLAVAAGMEKAGHAGNSFGDIVDAVNKVSQQTEEVSAAVEEIFSSAENMVHEMDGIVHLARETADNSGYVAAAAQQQTATIEQVASSAGTISRLAFELKALMLHFRYE